MNSQALAGSAPEVMGPLSMRLDGMLNLARDAMGVASTINGRTFGYPPSAATDPKLQAVRVDSIDNTVSDLAGVISDLHNALVELNNRI